MTRKKLQAPPDFRDSWRDDEEASLGFGATLPALTLVDDEEDAANLDFPRYGATMRKTPPLWAVSDLDDDEKTPSALRALTSR
jgi:hypothetical protein